MQLINKEWLSIAFVSRCLTALSAITPELECMAVVYSVAKFRCYVLGRPFELVIDHSAL